MACKSMAVVMAGLFIGTVFAGCTGGNIFGGESGLAGFIPAYLKCEYMPNPLGVDTLEPRFSWEMEHDERGQAQSAYQIIVSSSEKNLEKEIGDKWDSGKVGSSDQIEIEYAGSALSSSELCFWKVKLWDGEGHESSWSETAKFTMGLLNPNDWQGKWIGGGDMLRKEFTLDKEVKRATAYVTGLGYYELYINGEKVGDRTLDPGWTDFRVRVIYTTYDVTDMLNNGQNAVGAMLGSGHYINKEYSTNVKFMLQMNIEFTDGSTASVFSDTSWKVTSEGPITYEDIYNGETYDARKEMPGWDIPGFDDSKWIAASEVNDACGTLVSYVGPPIRVTGTIVPVAVTNPSPGVYVFDMGQNFAGRPQLTVEGLAGTVVTMRHAEMIYDNGTINQENLMEALQTDTYILKGEGVEIYEPRFVYHGFRYVQVEGFPGTPAIDSIRGRVVHSDVERIGDFTCSNSLLNQIFSCVIWNQKSNIMSIPTDDCQRAERSGWTGDAQLAVGQAARNFDVATFHEKWAHDLRDAQEGNGGIPNLAPIAPAGMPSKSGGNMFPYDPVWGCAGVIIPWEIYQQYGDIRILEQNYEMMKNWVGYLTSLSVGNIVQLGFFGDWCPPSDIQFNLMRTVLGMDNGFPFLMPLVFSTTLPQVASTFIYYQDALILSEAAEILGKTEDAQTYRTLAGDIRNAFNTVLYNPAFRTYTPLPSEVLNTVEVPDLQIQTSNALALYYGIPEDSEIDFVFETLLNDIEAKGTHIWTGILGARYLLQTLTNYGRADVAYQIATQTTYPSWGYMVENGATTLWERWEKLEGPNMASLNHMMYGAGIGEWIYSGLMGINTDPNAPGYERFSIKPQIVGDLTSAKGSIDTIRGPVSCEWEKEANSISMKVTIPGNTKATVYVPSMRINEVTVTEGGTVVWDGSSFIEEVPGIYFGNKCIDYIMFEVGSGEYSFEVKW